MRKKVWNERSPGDFCGSYNREDKEMHGIARYWRTEVYNMQERQVYQWFRRRATKEGNNG